MIFKENCNIIRRLIGSKGRLVFLFRVIIYSWDKIVSANFRCVFRWCSMFHVSFSTLSPLIPRCQRRKTHKIQSHVVIDIKFNLFHQNFGAGTKKLETQQRSIRHQLTNCCTHVVPIDQRTANYQYIVIIAS